MSFILEGRKTQLFVICQGFLSNNTSFIRLLFFGTFSLFTYISRNWFLHWLILSFRAVSNQSVQFRFRLSLSFSLCVCAYLNHALFLCQVFTLSIQMFWYQKVYLHLEWTLPKEMQINGLVDVIIMITSTNPLICISLGRVHSRCKYTFWYQNIWMV